MTRLSDAAFESMRRRKVSSIPSNERWDALCEAEPKRTETTPNRKTPRTTAMRDLREDSRFIGSPSNIEVSIRSTKKAGGNRSLFDDDSTTKLAY